MIWIGCWLWLFGVWPFLTLELHHDDIPQPVLFLDRVAHVVGVAIVVVCIISWAVP